MPDAHNVKYPPLDGSLLLSDTLDFHVEHNPSLTLFASTTSEFDETLVEITALEFARATHRAAYALRPVGGDLKAGQVIGLMAITDTLMYQTVFMGLVQAGLIPFPISPRLSAVAVASLLERAGARHLITTPSFLGSLVDEVRAISAIEILGIPEFGRVYPHFGKETSTNEFEAYPSERRGADDTILYMHSSGSTGLPKPIRHTNLSVSLWAGLPCIVDMKLYSPPIRLATMPLPPFHILGLHMQLMVPLYTCRSVGLYPPVFCTGLASSPITPSPSNILHHMTLTSSTATVVPPTTLQTWSIEQSAVDFLKTLQWVGFAGGPLVPETGDYLWSAGVNIASLYGTTELGGIGATPFDLGASGPSMLPNGEPARPWSYLRFNDQTSRLWIPQGNGTSELVFLTCPTHIPAVLNYGDKEGYSTSDLFTPHPTAPDTWYFIGRKDDVILHATGEKTVPAPFEDILGASPLVAGVLMFGEARDQAGVLIELRDHVEGSTDELKDLLWPLITKANASVGAFSRVFREMVLFVDPEKPLPRVAKGTVARKAALQLYKEEIDELYQALADTRNSMTHITAPTLAEFSDLAFVQAWIRAHVNEIEPDIQISPKEDLFEQGLDSLSATFLRHRIVSAIAPLDKQVSNNITQSVIYEHPTLELLSSYLSSLLSSRPAGPIPHQSTLIADLLSKYRSQPHSRGKETVLLTGSTGALGSNILAGLLLDERVERVWAVNRSEPKEAMRKQQKSFRNQGLDLDLLNNGKISFVSGNLYKEDLGVSESVFGQLQHTTTSIIHNAWRLDFNLSLASYEPHLAGTKNLINLAQYKGIKMFFTSSVSAAQGWDKSRGLVPEDILTDTDVAVGGGYGASKYVAEHIVASSGLPGCSFRIGQISGGDATGAWSTTDWFPILVKTSIGLGMLPDARGVVSWVPMDHVASRIVDTVLNYETQAPPVLNVVHPDPVPWTSVATSVSDVLVEAGITLQNLPLRPFSEWFQALEKAAQDPSALNDLPAAKMLSFYHKLALNASFSATDTDESLGIPHFATSTKAGVSARISKQDVRKWVGFWKSQGFM